MGSVNEVETHEIEGYRTCPCGALVLEATAEMQSGLCGECFKVKRAPLEVVEIMHRGQRAMLPARRHKPKAGSKGSKRKSKTVEAAKKAALKRLRMLYPAMYDMLYDEERALRGLAPITRVDHPPHDDALQTYPFESVYAALTKLPGAQ